MTTEEKHCVSCGLFLREGLSDEGLCLVKRVVRSCADICDYDEDAEFMDITPHDEKFTVGTSVEDNMSIYRMDTLLGIPNINRFVSFEPLLECLDFDDLPMSDLCGIGWMIVGAETGTKARPMPADAASRLLICADYHGIPYFFKKWSKGYEPDNLEMPREFPEFRKDVSL